MWPGCVSHCQWCLCVVVSFSLLSITCFLEHLNSIMYWRGQIERGGEEAAQFGVLPLSFQMFYSQSFSPSMGLLGFVILVWVGDFE